MRPQIYPIIDESFQNQFDLQKYWMQNKNLKSPVDIFYLTDSEAVSGLINPSTQSLAAK